VVQEDYPFQLRKEEAVLARLYALFVRFFSRSLTAREDTQLNDAPKDASKR
jgi:hypothetical protein